jgi:hypothetical protein
MSENNGAGRLTSADELLAQSRKVVELPDGITVEIRRVGKAKLAQIIRGIPDVSALARLKDQDEKDTDERSSDQKLAAGEAIGRMMEGVILAGVRSPQLSADGSTGPSPSDFSPEQQGILFREILALSRFSQEVGEGVLPLSKTAG